MYAKQEYLFTCRNRVHVFFCHVGNKFVLNHIINASRLVIVDRVGVDSDSLYCIEFIGSSSAYGTVSEKMILQKCYKNPLHMDHCNFPTVNTINFLFSTLHTTPFLYGKIHFGVLHMLRVSIATSNTPPGSNSP